MTSDLSRRKPGSPVVLGVLMACLVLLGVAVLPAFASEGGEGNVARPAASPDESTETTVTTEAPTTTTTLSPAETFEAAAASMTDEERYALRLFLMSAAERDAFARFLSPPPAPSPAAQPQVVATEPTASAPVAASGSIWDQIASCESGGNWATPPVGSYGYSGGLMFLPSTWSAYGGGEFASEAYLASRDAQIVVAERILADHGGSYRAWPGCRAKLGLP